MPLPQSPPIRCPATLGSQVELRVVRNDGWVMAPHWHLRPQLFCTIEGEGEVLVGRHEPVRVPPGGLILVPSGAPHTAYGVGGGSWSFYSFLFDAGAHAEPHHTAAATAFARTTPAARAFAALVTAVVAKRGAASVAALHDLTAMLSSASPDSTDDTGTPTDRVPKTGTIRGTVAEAARAHGVSTAHFSRTFAQAFGMPPHRFRLNARVERALALVRSGVSVTDAAAMAEFRDASHFARSCKRLTGLTPRSFGRSGADG